MCKCTDYFSSMRPTCVPESASKAIKAMLGDDFKVSEVSANISCNKCGKSATVSVEIADVGFKVHHLNPVH